MTATMQYINAVDTIEYAARMIAEGINTGKHRRRIALMQYALDEYIRDAKAEEEHAWVRSQLLAPFEAFRHTFNAN